MWSGLAMVVFWSGCRSSTIRLAQDPGAWPIYAVQLELARPYAARDRQRDRRFCPLDIARSVDVRVQRAGQNSHDRGSGRLCSRRARTASIEPASVVGACILVGPPLALVMLPAGPWNLARIRGNPTRACSGCRAQACAGWPSSPPQPLRWGGCRSPGTTSSATTSKDGVLSFMDANPETSRGPETHSIRPRSPSGSGGSVGKGLTNGTQTQGGFLPVQATDFVFATLAEELGFVGGVVLFVLFDAAPLAHSRAQGLGDEKIHSGRSSGRPGLDDPVPARRGERRDGPRDHADHPGIPLPFVTPWRRFTREHRDRAGHRAERQHPAAPRRVVNGRGGAAPTLDG